MSALCQKRTYRPHIRVLSLMMLFPLKATVSQAMKRREFISLFGGALLGSAVLACPRAAPAQQKFKVGLLVAGADMNMAFFSEPFINKLAEFGYVEGKNLSVERRS